MGIFANYNIKKSGDIMYSLYSYRKKRPYGLIITIILISAIAGTSCYLVIKKLKEPVIPEKIETKVYEEPAAITYKDKETVYTENSDFDLTTYYLCGHKENSVSKIPKAFFGKTIDEIKDTHTEYDIYSYTDTKIFANEVLTANCNNHYIIILKGRKLISYNKNTPTIIEREAYLNLNDFLEDDIEILKNGIEVASKTELLEYFEGFAS